MADLETDIELVERLLDIEEGLSDWEADFAEQLGKRVHDQEWELSIKQRNRAQKILRRVEADNDGV